jgi:ribonuclease Z
MIMIRCVVLGSGAAIPSPERNTCSIAMKYDGSVYLFDCGEGTQRQMMKSDISYSKVKSIFITHLHDDHILGIPGLIYTLYLESTKQGGRREKVTIFGPKGVAKRVQQLVNRNISFLEIQEVDEGWAVDIGNATISAFRTNHYSYNFDSVSSKGDSLGYVFEEKEKLRFDKKKCEELGIKGRMFSILEKEKEIKVHGKTVRIEEVTYPKKGKKIVITGDTAFSENTIKFAKDADILFHEATYLEDRRKDADLYAHSTASDAAKVAKEAGVHELVLYHISNRYTDEDAILKEAKSIFKNTKVASDGFEVKI